MRILKRGFLYGVLKTVFKMVTFLRGCCMGILNEDFVGDFNGKLT